MRMERSTEAAERRPDVAVQNGRATDGGHQAPAPPARVRSRWQPAGGIHNILLAAGPAATHLSTQTLPLGPPVACVLATGPAPSA
jgi:hypothetical protein